MALSLKQKPQLVYLLIALPLWAIMVWGAFSLQITTNWSTGDYWEHSAALRALMQDLLDPANAHLASAAASTRYMPFYLLVAAIGQALQLTPFQAMGLAGALTATLLVVAVPLFFNRCLRNPWAGAIALPLMLLGWGSSWLWSNVYQLRTLFYTLAYPSTFAFALSLLLFGLQIRILRNRRGNVWRLPLLALLLNIVLLAHPLTGAFAGPTLGLLVLTAADGSRRIRAWSLGFLLLGTVAVLLWPWYSVWDTIASHSIWDVFRGHASAVVETGKASLRGADRARSLLAEHPFYSLPQVLLSFGPLLAGIPVLLWMALRRIHLFAPLGATLMLLPYVANLWFNIPLGPRFLLYEFFYCQFALSWLLLGVFAPATGSATAGRALRWSVATLFAVTIAWNLALTAIEINGGHFGVDGNYQPHHHQSGWRQAGPTPLVRQYRELASHIDDDAVVMARKATSWPLPSFSGKVIALQNPNPLVRDQRQRAEQVARFFAATTTDAERREILSRYAATHVLFLRDKAAQPLLRFLDALPGRRFRSGDLELIALQAAG